jgi:lipid-A-disaccharide synthase-like uncharacterized protein
MNASMSLRTKSILMNCAVTVALLYKLWRGAPIAVIVIVGIFMFTLVNLVMFFAAQKSAPRNS